jgi:FkbM family methyltransferase
MYKYNEFHGEIQDGKSVDQVLREYFPKNTGVFFDVGAFEPIYISNSYHFEQNGWDCYCFEANTSLIPLLKSKRKNVYNYAITNENKETGPFSVIHFNNYDRDWTASYSAIKVSQEYFNLIPAPNSHTHEIIDVQYKTLNSIIETEISEVKSIDILSIDVEGGELNVLYGLDLNKYQPKLILVENLLNDSNVNNYLESNGYRLDKHISYNQYFVHNTYNK